MVERKETRYENNRHPVRHPVVQDGQTRTLAVRGERPRAVGHRGTCGTGPDFTTFQGATLSIRIVCRLSWNADAQRTERMKGQIMINHVTVKVKDFNKEEAFYAAFVHDPEGNNIEAMHN